MGKFSLTAFLLLIAVSVFSQNTFPDELRKKLEGKPHDSLYVDQLNEAASQYLRSSPAASRTIITESIELSEKLGYKKGYARALTVMGNTYWYEGVYEFAQNYYLLAARQYQITKDSTGLGETYNNIGEVYKKLNDTRNALEYLTRAANLIQKDSIRKSLILYNIAELYIRLNDIEKAKSFTNQSMAIATKTQNNRIIAYNYWNLAAIQVRLNKFQSALAYYSDAEKIWKQENELRSLIQTYQDIAEVYLKLKNFDEAEKYLQQSIQLSHEVKVTDLQVKNYQRFARLDSLRGDFKSAYYYLSLHNQLKDSVYNILKAEQIARLQTIYETETREIENKQLRTEKSLKESELASQKITLLAISTGLLISGFLIWMLSRQRKKILFQKEALEIQSGALLQLNAELQELNKSLEARITERTSQLGVQNKRLAEYTFINAHKLRAPVASILGLINLLHQTNPEEQPTILAHLKTCGEQLDKIIHDVSRDLEDAIVNENETE